MPLDTTKEQEYLTLKWGSLKAWDLKDPKCLELLKRWHALGVSASAIAQHDTDEQKEIICELIDACNCESVYLDWDDKHVSKEEAKRYVREYNVIT